jgi:hypothetical protein
MGFVDWLRISQPQQKILGGKRALLVLARGMSDLLALLAIHHCEPNGKQSFLKRALLMQLLQPSRSELLLAGDLV